MKFRFLILIFFVMTFNAAYSQRFENFITVSGYKLMDGKEEFRFISYNIPNLNYIEDEMEFHTEYPYRLPDEYEVRDAIATVKELGGRIIRIYTIPVRNSSLPDHVATHVESPGVFNEEAFKVNDLMLAVANEMGIRIIFPLLNNWEWLGGRPQYADFRGKTADEFWADKQLIKDFKKTIEYTLNRTNTITGVKYKDDKAIMCWETGNELTNPHEWAVEIARYIKSIDRNHLLMDGYYAIDSRPVREESILEPSIDIVSSHHYEVNPFELPENIKRNLDVIKGRKPYVIGEFGFESTTALEKMVNEVIADHEIAGALIWSLRFHRKEGGYYWHSEPAGLGLYKAYHWPGFDSGEEYDERSFLDIYRKKAYEIQGLDVPEIKVLEKPKLLPINNVFNINWQGSIGAAGYNVERSETQDGPWEVAGYNISDAAVQYASLFYDKSAEPGKEYFYRIKAMNNAGISEPSNIVGPVKVNRLALIDEMKNVGVLYHSENISIATGDDRRCKEDMYRIKGQYGSEIIYFVPGKFDEYKIYSYENNNYPGLKVFVSEDGKSFNEIETKHDVISKNAGSYGYLKPKLYSYLKNTNNIRYIKLFYKEEVQISRVEIFYK